YRQRGYGLLDAAIQGARDVAVPITFSILTNIVAFAPLLFVPGWIGKIWSVIPAVVCTVFLVSLIEAMVILPAHLANAKPGNSTKGFHHWQQKFSENFSAVVEKYYAPLVAAAVKARYLSIAIGITLMLLVLSWPLSGRMGFELFPTVESDRSEARAVLPLGSPEDEIRRVETILVSSARKLIEQNGGESLSTGVYSSVEENELTIRTYLTGPEVRPVQTAEFTNMWRNEVGQIPGTESLRFAADAGGPGSGPGFTVELSHRDVEVLRRASEKLAQSLSEYPLLSEIDDGFQEGKQQFNFRLKEEARRLGLTSNEIGRQIRSAFFGAEALRQQRGRNEIKVLVLSPERERSSQTDVKDLLIRTPDNVLVPLHTLVEFAPSRAYSSITRRDGRRTVTVTANVNPRKEAQTVKQSVEQDVLPQLMTDYPGLSYSFEGRQRQFTDAIVALAYGYIGVLIGIYILLAVPFKSYLQPLIVMFAIPFGIFGAIIGHLIMGYSMSIISMMGVIALSGVVVNDSLVMVTHANDKIRGGMQPLAAICSSGVRRFRPILLTTISTFGGLAPMIFETSRQARFMIPLALSLGYGILFATAITLLLVPCLFMVIEDIRSKLGTDIRTMK
ncbi:MAG: efflux RND transporter permease subunit, partial [Limnobacter sp.]|nr:efflux RND transporter permease subunit [Limnobacter sp.]